MILGFALLPCLIMFVFVIILRWYAYMVERWPLPQSLVCLSTWTTKWSSLHPWFLLCIQNKQHYHHKFIFQLHERSWSSLNTHIQTCIHHHTTTKQKFWLTSNDDHALVAHITNYKFWDVTITTYNNCTIQACIWKSRNISSQEDHPT